MNSIGRSTLLPCSPYVTEFASIKPTTVSSLFGTFSLKSISSFVDPGLPIFLKGPCSCKAISKDVYRGGTPHLVESCGEQAVANFHPKKILTDESPVGSHANSVEISGCEDDKEIQRKRKIGLANKGKVPWNKGRKHSQETLEKIKQRTKEALKDPKVRKKMSECPRALSDETKARIRSSLKKLWGKRLQWKRSRVKFLQSWFESIANAAKIGGIEQQELEWDSYDKIKEEISLQQLQQAAEKVKAKEMADIRAQKAAKAKAEKTAKLAQKKKQQVENAKLRVESNRRERKSNEEKEQLAISNELKLKQRLVKIHRKKSAISQVSSQRGRPWEKFDVDSVKKEKLQQVISLADQIRFAKNRRAEYAAQESPGTLPSSSQLSGNTSNKS